MTLVADTNTAQANERLELWHEVHNSEFGPAVVRSTHARPFAGMWRYELGCVRLYRIVADASTFLRPPKLIARTRASPGPARRPGRVG